MARSEIDPIDVVALVIVPILGAMVLGVWSLQIDVFGGFELTDPIWTGHGARITPAFLGTIAGLAWIVGTNELDGSDYEQHEFAVIVAAFLVVPLYEFVPAVGELVEAHDVVALSLALLLAAATVLISYIE